MDHPPKAAEPEAEAKAKAFAAAVPNGAPRKHRPLPEAAVDILYRECLKNHAASLGGHALDGCGEFLLSPAADPADPTSLRCAACGCHRNFHRRLVDPLHRHHRPEGEGEDERDGTEDDDEDDVDDEEKVDGGRHRPQRSSPSPPPLFCSSAPHMLLALSAGLPGGIPPAPAPARPAVEAAAGRPRKRFRTKFSPEQKGRMQELSERLGWRMQKRDEGLVEECCREIGVDKGVFKVWMHNNKHNFFGLARRGDAAAGRNGGSVGVGGQIEGAGHHRASGGDDGDGGNGHVVNGSFSPS